jgi:hypothetical protein
MSNEAAQTKLPSQVAKIGKAAEALAEETGIKPGSKPLKPVETASAIVNKEPAKVDQNDWKERHARYQTATDATIAGLRQELAAANATITELRTQVEQKPVVTAVPAKTESVIGTKEDPAYKEYLDRLPKSVKDDYEESYLFDQFLIQSAASPKQEKPSKSEELSALESKIENVVQFQERTKAELYEDAMDAAFPNDEWITLANGEQWTNFCKQRVSEVDPRTYGEIVKQGNDLHTATTVIWVLKQYKQHLSTLEAGDSAGDDAATILESQLTPEAAGGGSDPVTEINAQAETFTQSQVDQFFKDAATTKKYSAEQAQAIEKSIIAAHAAGKVIPG